MAAQTDGAGPRDETAAAAAGAGAAGAAAAAGPASEPATAAPLAPVVEGGVGEGARSGSKREHPDGQEESLNIRIACGKASTTVSLHPLTTVAELKKDIESQTGLPPANQKLLFKGQLRDEQTLAEAGLKQGSKIIVMGSTLTDIKVATAAASATKAGNALEWDAKKQEVWSEQEQHKKVLAKGRPDDGWVGIAGKQEPLRDDQTYIPGLLNSQGTRVRLTFKPEIQQVWIGSATSTQKVMTASISKIEAQAVKGQEAYSIVCMQLGAAATSRLWLYYVPSQAVSGIKIRILGVSALL